MAAIEREEFNDRLDLVMDGIAGIHDRLDVLNGRVRISENHITAINAVMSEREKVTAKDPTARYAGLGAALAAVGSYLYQWWTK